MASLHQAIADVIPARVQFYDGWLSNPGLRAGTIELAPLYAVLSFLREEGRMYDAVTARAGVYAADWTVDSMSSRRRSMVRAAPRWLRSRLVARVARRLVRETYESSRCSVKVRRGMPRVEIVESIFCTVRTPAACPLCGFYASAFSRLWALFDMECRAQVVECRGAGQASCVVQFWPPSESTNALTHEAGVS